jgi:hypothetical protein
MKNDRDLPVYAVWKTCMLPNEEIGRIFGMSYSAIRHILGFMQNRIEEEPGLQAKFVGGWGTSVKTSQRYLKFRNLGI